MASFEEINAFIDSKGHLPTRSRDIGERKLASQPEGLRADSEKAGSLLQYDRNDLLAGVVSNPTETGSPIEINSVDDILADDVLGLLDPNNEEAIAADIFTPRNVSRPAAQPDHVARRKPCNEFDQFEPLFIQASADLKSEIKKTVPFKSMPRGLVIATLALAVCFATLHTTYNVTRLREQNESNSTPLRDHTLRGIRFIDAARSNSFRWPDELQQ